MTKADKMFQKLGYYMNINEDYITYKDDIGDVIEFDLVTKEIIIFNHKWEDVILTIDDINAINEKIKELGFKK